MTPENQHFDRESLRKVTGKTAAWAELALDCVAFANAQGGSLLIGIEDDQEAPLPGQTVPPGLAEDLEQKRGRGAQKEFESYKTRTCRKIEETRVEVLHAGFGAAWASKD